MGKEVGRVVLWCLAGVFLLLPIAAAAGPGLVRAAVTTNAPAASELTCSFPVNHVCPANGNKLDEQARQRQTTATSTPQPQPYGPANGPIRPLPSVTPAAPPEPTPRAIGESTGGLLGKLIPELAPVIEGGLKAIGPVPAP